MAAAFVPLLVLGGEGEHVVVSRDEGEKRDMP